MASWDIARISTASVGVRVAGYVRPPAGDGPFRLVVLHHRGGSPAKSAQAENAKGLTKLRAEE